MGNGINRCLKSDISWENLLKKSAEKHGIEKLPDISLPMQFEFLANEILKKEAKPSDQIYKTLKEEISEKLKRVSLTDNAPHFFLTKISDCIITTNYDYLIEQSIDKSFSSDDLKNNSPGNKYNLNIYNEVKGDDEKIKKRVYHIHGQINQVQSICLGYEHYAGALQNLRSRIVVKRKENDDTEEPAILEFLRKKSTIHNTWATRFFTDDIHIIGADFDRSEIDLWWLITYRAYLYYSNYLGAKELIKNKIVYHDIVDYNSNRKREKINKKELLKSCEVVYCEYPINNSENESYFEQYTKIAGEINSGFD